MHVQAPPSTTPAAPASEAAATATEPATAAAAEAAAAQADAVGGSADGPEDMEGVVHAGEMPPPPPPPMDSDSGDEGGADGGSDSGGASDEDGGEDGEQGLDPETLHAALMAGERNEDNSSNVVCTTPVPCSFGLILLSRCLCLRIHYFPYLLL